MDLAKFTEMYRILEMPACTYVYLCYLTFTASRPTSELCHVYRACSIAVITFEAHCEMFAVFSLHSQPHRFKHFPQHLSRIPEITKFYTHTRRKLKLQICVSVSRVLAWSREDETLLNGMLETFLLLRLCVVVICYNSSVSGDPDSCLNVATFGGDLLAVSTLCCILLTRQC